jgi:hypothetical protein
LGIRRPLGEVSAAAIAASQVGVDRLAIDGELGQLLAHRLLLVEAGLPRVEEGGADHQVGDVEQAQRVGEGAVAMQRAADEAGRARVAIEQHVVPWDQHVVEDQQGVDLVEAVGERIVGRRAAAGEAGAADMLQTRRVHRADEAHRIVRQLVVAPVGDGRLDEGLVGIGGRRLVLGAAHDDAGIRLLHDMQQHVGVLLLRPARAVALGIGVGRDVEDVARAAPSGCGWRCWR